VNNFDNITMILMLLLMGVLIWNMYLTEQKFNKVEMRLSSVENK